MIRVKNVSSHDYQNVTLINQTISTISSGQKSSYYIFEEAYEYGYIELDVDGATYKLIPIDFVGESPLKNGKYTYEIDADLMRGGDVLSLKFVED